MKKIVVLSGAGISAESGISTFRDSGGLWEGHEVMEVAAPEGRRRNPELVLDFYNQRRKQALLAMLDTGHSSLVENLKKLMFLNRKVAGHKSKKSKGASPELPSLTSQEADHYFGFKH